MISHFRDKVLLPRSEFTTLVRTAAQYRMVAGELRERLTDEHALLLNALQQLALERGAKDIHHFTRRWIDERRSAD